MGGVSLPGTKSANGTVSVNGTGRGDGWYVVGWYQECERHGEG